MRILERLGLTTMGQLEAALDNVSSEFLHLTKKIKEYYKEKINQAKEETNTQWIKALNDLDEYRVNLVPREDKISVSFRLKMGTKAFHKFLLRSDIPGWSRSEEDNGQVILSTTIETAEIPTLKQKIDETLQYVQGLENRFIEAEIMREVLK